MNQKQTQLLKDTLTTAVEGGSSYWCAAQRVERDRSLNAIRVVAPYDREDADTKWDDITLETVKLGFDRILNKEVHVNSDNYGCIYTDWHEPDACCMDAEAADCVVQAGLFNKIVYG